MREEHMNKVIATRIIKLELFLSSRARVDTHLVMHELHEVLEAVGSR